MSNDKVSVVRGSNLKRNDVPGAVKLYRRALELNREGKLAEEIGEIGQSIMMLQDDATELLAALEREGLIK